MNLSENQVLVWNVIRDHAKVNDTAITKTEIEQLLKERGTPLAIHLLDEALQRLREKGYVRNGENRYRRTIILLRNV